MNYVAEEVREIMAKLGFKSIDEMVGHVDRLELRSAIDHWKAKGLDYSKILYRPEVGPEVGTYCQMKQDHLLDKSLDVTQILELAKPAIENGSSVEIDLPIVNTNRVVGTMTELKFPENTALKDSLKIPSKSILRVPPVKA